MKYVLICELTDHPHWVIYALKDKWIKLTNYPLLSDTISVENMRHILVEEDGDRYLTEKEAKELILEQL